MTELFAAGLDVSPVVTHTMPFTDFEQAFQLMAAGQAGKIALLF
jgi:threonine 3-dehydrogenase